MILVHHNGDLTIPGPRIALSMYRPVVDDRYEPAFDAPCEARMFIGQHAASPRPTAFYWRCRVLGETTCVSRCRDCPVSGEDRERFLAFTRPRTYRRPAGPPTEADRQAFREFQSRLRRGS